MKKLISWLCVCALVLMLVPQAVLASGEPGVENGWRYMLDSTNTSAVVMEYAASVPADGILTVPGTLGGKPVKAIGFQVWETEMYPNPLFKVTAQQRVKVLNLPASVNLISEAAFEGLTSLTAVNISDGDAFRSDSGVLFDKNFGGNERLRLYPASKPESTYIIPSTTKEIASDAFAGSKFLKTITIPANVTTVGVGVFASARSLANVTFQNSLAALPNSTFKDCQSLTSVTLPSGLTQIGNYSFDGAVALETLSIPVSVTHIGESAFGGCASLKSVTLPSGLTNLGAFAFAGTKALREVTLPSGMTEIAEGAFISSGIRTVVIPYSVTKIGPLAFSDCADLTLVQLPASRLEIALGAFSYTPQLTGIDFSAPTFVSIDELAFAASGLERVNLTDNVSDIGANSFAKSPKLARISIGSAIPYLPVGVFSTLDSLASVYIPETVIAIDDSAFAWNKNMTGAYFLGDAPSFGLNGVNVFYGANTGFKVHYPSANSNTFALKDGKWKGYAAQADASVTAPVTNTMTLAAGANGKIVGGVSGNYESGEIITMRAQANPGYTFVNWTSVGGGTFSSATSASTTFTMGSGGTTVTANFTAQSTAQTPTFIQQPPATVNAVQGAPSDILLAPAETTDGGTITYQWYVNTANSNTGGTAIPDATNASFLPPTDPAGTFYYYVVATNTVGSLTPTTTSSSPIKVTVVAKTDAATPVFVNNISGSSTYTLNAAATALDVLASAPDYGRITYQWYVNTTNGTTGGTPIDGATQRTYTPTTGTNGTFYYYAVASNYNKFATGNTLAYATSGVKTVTVGDGGGNGNNGNTGDSGGSTTTPSQDSNNILPVVPTVVDSTATVVVESTALDTRIDYAVSQAVKSDTTAVVVIEVKASANATAFELELPTASLEKLAEPDKDIQTELVINTALGSITFDTNALAQICENAGAKVTLTVALVDTSKLPQSVDVGNRPVYEFTLKSGDSEITNFKNGKVKVTLPYKLADTEASSHVFAYYVDKNGNLHPVKESMHNDKLHVIQFATNHFSMYTVGVSPKTFPDVTDSIWYASAVEFVASREIFAGMGNGTFAPTTPMTRGMFVTVLANLEGEAAQGDYANTFSDVAANMYYAKPIAWATANNIVAGVGGGKFAPNQEINREQMAAMLNNYIQYKGIHINKLNTQPFEDYDAVSAWAKDSVGAIRDYGILNGVGGNVFAPKNLASRAEVATVFMKYIEALFR